MDIVTIAINQLNIVKLSEMTLLISTPVSTTAMDVCAKNNHLSVQI